MIAVHAEAAEHKLVAEFFELFKTPWEFFRDGSKAEVVICSGAGIPETKARLLLIYDGKPNFFDQEREIQVRAQGSGTKVLYQGREMGIYGSCLAFPRSPDAGLKTQAAGQAAMLKFNANGQVVVRIGYDLFQEIRLLLTRGQPPADAGIPALELHIALLRDLISGAGVSLVEIPPVPAGNDFITCLTHDVDHVGIRNHKFDHTMFGFLYRGTLGSLRDFFRGRKTWRQLGANWLAVLKLPLVHLGLARDFWYQFDHYVEIENGAASTFFVIPKKDETGLDANGNRPAKRAASYDAMDLGSHIRKLQAAGKEIGLHGIDAWRDADAGRSEHEIMAGLAGAGGLGVRMHWLYFDEKSPAELERAGFAYDSTVGFNETVGYRAGTTQVYKPVCAEKLLELPMHIMDTALFYPDYLDLSPARAQEQIRPLITNAVRFGGALTVNWHDRSIAPERLWDDSYRHLLEECKARGAWFASAAQTVAWFQKRRAVTFTPAPDGGMKISAAASHEALPGLRVRRFQPGSDGGKWVELSLPDGGEICLAA